MDGWMDGGEGGKKRWLIKKNLESYTYFSSADAKRLRRFLYNTEAFDKMIPAGVLMTLEASADLVKIHYQAVARAR